MHALLDLVWNHHLATMAGAYVAFLVVMVLIVYALWRPQRPEAHARAAALSVLLALLPWLVLKIGVYEGLGGFALSVAQQMPKGHPQLAEFERARRAYDLEALKRWAQANRDPVDAGVIAKTQAALDRLPASAFKTQLERELATGYLSKERFEASALSIIQISVKELGDNRALIELATQLDSNAARTAATKDRTSSSSSPDDPQ